MGLSSDRTRKRRLHVGIHGQVLFPIEDIGIEVSKLIMQIIQGGLNFIAVSHHEIRPVVSMSRTETGRVGCARWIVVVVGTEPIINSARAADLVGRVPVYSPAEEGGFIVRLECVRRIEAQV